MLRRKSARLLLTLNTVPKTKTKPKGSQSTKEDCWDTRGMAPQNESCASAVPYDKMCNVSREGMKKAVHRQSVCQGSHNLDKELKHSAKCASQCLPVAGLRSHVLAKRKMRKSVPAMQVLVHIWMMYLSI